MFWTILWIGKQESGATLQSIAPLFGWSSFQTRGTGISWRIVRSLLASCLEMLALGTNWTKRGRSTIGDTVNTELLFQRVHSVNQISVYAAVTDWCYKFCLTKEKRTSRCSCGLWNFDHCGTRRIVSLPRCNGAWASEHWKRGYRWHNYAKKNLFQDLVAAVKCCKIRPDDDDRGRNVLFNAEIIRILEFIRKLELWQLFPQAWRVWNRSCDYINLQTHWHILRCDIQRDSALWTKLINTKEKRGPVMSCSEIFRTKKKVKRSKESWAAPSMKETRAGSLSLCLIPNNASLFTKRTIPMSEKKWKWKVIHTHSRYGGDLAVSISKTITTMSRHFNQEERQDSLMVQDIGIQSNQYARFQSRSVVTQDFWRQHEETNWNNVLLASLWRTLWWYSNRARIDGSCIYPSLLEHVHNS